MDEDKPDTTKLVGDGTSANNWWWRNLTRQFLDQMVPIRNVRIHDAVGGEQIVPCKERTKTKTNDGGLQSNGDMVLTFCSK